MKHKLILCLSLVLLLTNCKEKKISSTELKQHKEKLTELKKQMNVLSKEISTLETSILKAEGKPVSVTTKLVTTMYPSVEDFAHYIDIQGEVKCEENVALTTDMGGLVTKVLVTEGQNVSRGQVLATTDNSVILKNIDEVDEQLALVTTIYEKQKRLWDQHIGSQIQLLQAESNRNALLKKKQSIYAQMEKSNIKSSVNGTVDKVFIKVGELASPGIPAIRVVNLNNMNIEAEVPETYAGKIHTGDIVKVEIPALDNKIISARVKAVGSVINTLNRSFTAIVTFNSVQGLRPNMVAKIKIKDFIANNAIVIPSRLLQQHAGADYIILAQQDSSGKFIAKKKEIVLGKSYDGKSQVISGLKKSDQLLDEGYRDVLDGDEIIISKI